MTKGVARAARLCAALLLLALLAPGSLPVQLFPQTSFALQRPHTDHRAYLPLVLRAVRGCARRSTSGPSGSGRS